MRRSGPAHRLTALVLLLCWGWFSTGGVLAHHHRALRSAETRICLDQPCAVCGWLLLAKPAAVQTTTAPPEPPLITGDLPPAESGVVTQACHSISARAPPTA